MASFESRSKSWRCYSCWKIAEPTADGAADAATDATCSADADDASASASAVVAAGTSIGFAICTAAADAGTAGTSSARTVQCASAAAGWADDGRWNTDFVLWYVIWIINDFSFAFRRSFIILCHDCCLSLSPAALAEDACGCLGFVGIIHVLDVCREVVCWEVACQLFPAFSQPSSRLIAFCRSLSVCGPTPQEYWALFFFYSLSFGTSEVLC